MLSKLVESEYSTDDNLSVGAIILSVKFEVDVIAIFFPLINPSVAYMFTPAVVLMLAVMRPLCMAVVSIHKLGYVDE